MSKYYAIIARAVATTDSNKSRHRVYERARKFQSAQLRKVDPPLTESEIKRELAVLEEAIKRVEEETDRTSHITRIPSRSSKTQRILTTLLSGIIVIQAAFIVWLLSTPVPSTAQIDTDLSRVRDEIKHASIESEQYTPNALKTIIEFRRQTLLNTEAMLLQKRDSLLRRINLDFKIEGDRLQPANNAELNKIKEDIELAEQKVALSAKEASKYTGGLLQAMSQITVATNEVTVAQLWLKFYSAKYGMPFFLSKAANGEKEPALVPGNVVKDRDAL